MKATVTDRLVTKIEIGDCWNWTASKNNYGYGRLRVDGKTLYAHRLVYQWLVGPIPEDKECDHLCRNPACVNPDHIELVSRKVNVLRGESPSAKHAVKTHCPRGHEYDEDNTAMTLVNTRRCRACDRDRKRRIRGSKKS